MKILLLISVLCTCIPHVFLLYISSYQCFNICLFFILLIFNFDNGFREILVADDYYNKYKVDVFKYFEVYIYIDIFSNLLSQSLWILIPKIKRNQNKVFHR